MSAESAISYYNAMDVLQAREVIQANTSSLWPDIKPEKRQQYHKRLLKRAGYDTGKRVASASDLKRILGEGSDG